MAHVDGNQVAQLQYSLGDINPGFLAARVLRAYEVGDAPGFRCAALELAVRLNSESGVPAPQLVERARDVARHVIASAVDGPATQLAAQLVEESNPHLVLGLAGFMASSLPAGSCKDLARDLKRHGYLAPA